MFFAVDSTRTGRDMDKRSRQGTQCIGLLVSCFDHSADKLLFYLTLKISWDIVLASRLLMLVMTWFLIFCLMQALGPLVCFWSDVVKGVPRQQPHRRSGLATLPSVGAVP